MLSNPCSRYYIPLYYPKETQISPSPIVYNVPQPEDYEIGFTIAEGTVEPGRPTVEVREKHGKSWNETIEFFKWIYENRFSNN